MDAVLQNIAAFFTPVLLFIFWATVGYATLSILRSQRNTIQNLLLAPVVGYCTTLLPVFWLNRIGLPVSHFATILLVALAISSIAILYWRKPILPTRQYFPFAAILFLAFLLISTPFLRYGFNWISYSNDDVANYTLGALRVYNHGFFDLPDINELIQRKDYSLYYWFSHVPGMIRQGSELVIAWVSAVTGLYPVQIFMPVMVALHLMLISTTGALVYTSRKNYYIALTACLLLTFSALTVMGTFYELIAQVGGLSLLIVCLITMCQPFSNRGKLYALKESIFISLCFASFLLVYPELLAFLAIAIFMYFGLQLWKGWRINKSFSGIVLLVIIISCIFVNSYIFPIIEYVHLQCKIVAKATPMQIVLFPYFLLPSGLANLWGLMVLAVMIKEPYLSLAIISGAFLTLFVIYASFKQAVSRVSLPAIMAVVMICVGISLFMKNYGFGLFKLSMYAQPFLISVIAFSIFGLFTNKHWRNVFIAILIISGSGSFSYYFNRSKATSPGAFSELAYGSNTKVNKEYRDLISKLPDDTLILSDDFNISLIKSQAIQSRKHSFISLTTTENFYMSVLPNSYYIVPSVFAKKYGGDIGKIIANEYDKRSFYEANFNLHDNHSTNNKFVENNFDEFKNKHSVLVADTSLRSIFNRWHGTSDEETHNFTLKNVSEARNHLTFIDSALGRVYHSVISNNLNNLSLFNLEGDVSYHGKSMQAIGRHLLMRAFNPSKKVRLELAMTNTFDGNGSNKLPPVSAIGKSRVAFPVMGRGSARVFSETFSPQMVKGLPYVATDMNCEGKSFPSHRTGLMNLYNKNMDFDLRLVVTFVRDISLISEEDYLNLNAPSMISDFPSDLANKNLEYSGIYEDGWISEDAFFRLKHPAYGKRLIVQGMLPKIDPNFTGSTLTIVIDGKRFLSQKLLPGDFEINTPISGKDANHKVELHFSNGQKLPIGDDRPIGAKINTIGFV